MCLQETETGYAFHRRTMPAITDLKDFKGAKEYSNEDYITKVAIQNVMNVVKEIKMKSPLLKSMVDS